MTYVHWFLLALILVGLEMATGTFYLLVIAIAMAIGGSTALLGLGLTTQLALAGVTGIIGVVYLWRWREQHTLNTTTQSLDIGQAVKILTWNDDGTARVFYRGAAWNAELESQDIGHEGLFYIKAINGSVLILTNQK